MPLTAFAFGSPWEARRDVVRFAKAALLYADDVTADAMDIRWVTPWQDENGELASWETFNPNARPLEYLVPELWHAHERGRLRFWPRPDDFSWVLPATL